MKILVQAKPGAKQEQVRQIDQDQYSVAVKELPIKGQANQAIVKVLANHFQTASSNVILVKGHRSRYKVFEIKD
jgi:hypothetical protein